jgi:hypothetical protein
MTGFGLDLAGYSTGGISLAAVDISACHDLRKPIEAARVSHPQRVSGAGKCDDQ